MINTNYTPVIAPTKEMKIFIDISWCHFKMEKFFIIITSENLMQNYLKTKHQIMEKTI